LGLELLLHVIGHAKATANGRQGGLRHKALHTNQGNERSTN